MRANACIHSLIPRSRYDDPETLARKYKAIKGVGVAGVGMWTADSAGSNALTAESIWESVPRGK